MFFVRSSDQAYEYYIVCVLHYVFLSDIGNVYP
jgi:hypothetical protein